MRSLLISLVIVLAVAGLASAQEAPGAPAPPEPAPIATAPVGWMHDQGHAEMVRRGLVAGLPEGAENAEIVVDSFRPPDPGAQLIVSRVTFREPADPPAIVRARVDDLRRTVEVMGAGGEPLRQLGWQERSDDAGRLVEATLEWAHDGNQTLSMVRAVWVKLPGALAEYRVECVMTADAVAATRPACAQAMASIMLPPVAQREPLAPAPPLAPVTTDEDPATDEPAQPAIRQTPEGVEPVVMAKPPKQEAERDLRPFWLGGGLLLLGFALWWSNQRRKKVLEADDAEKASRADGASGPDELDADLTGAADPEPESEPESDRKEDRPT